MSAVPSKTSLHSPNVAEQKRSLTRSLLNRHMVQALQDSVISGSYVLKYICGKDDAPISDIDICLPFTDYETMKAYGMEIEDYHDDTPERQRPAKNTTHLTANEDDHKTDQVLIDRPDYASLLPS
ncbi:hypothetical protein NM688_g572 [Phlebia brevispora]|uniref:Uncharacterized protein n=1 Tax=Phlebia brevispora TaxID=194682 RepID=A0ACC1TDX8_9APHY|nr:hypothetical protein NM688_g572 [Phlebia brevispora]